MSRFDFSQENEVKNLTAGDIKNLTLVKISAEPLKKDDPDSSTVLRFYLEKDGYQASITEMPVNESWANGDKSKLDKMYSEQSRRIMHILSSFVPDAELKGIKASTWEELCEQVVKVSGEAFKGQLFQAILLYNGSGSFLRFPKYTNPPFFLNMKSPAVVGVSNYDKKFLTIPDVKPDDIEDDVKDAVVSF